jgi:hypothetical protein
MKTTKLLAMSMALCLGATSAFAQPTNDDCGDALPLNIGRFGDALTSGTNVGAGTQGPTIDIPATCWGTAADATVWYTFSVPAGPDVDITISTDEADGNGADTQIQLFSTPTDCDSLVAIDCDEDGGVCSAFGSEINISLATGTYYIQVDIFDTDESAFGISVTDDNASSDNDCYANAIDVSSNIASVVYGAGTNNPFTCQTYNYLNVQQDPIFTEGTRYNDCNNNLSPNVQETHYGVWFKFFVDANTPDTWVSAIPVDGDKCDNGESSGIFYSLHLFDTIVSYDCSSNLNLSSKDCSIGDISTTTHGASRDKACGSLSSNGRLSLAGLPLGWHTVMVSQMTRVTNGIGDCFQVYTNPTTGQADTVYYPCGAETVAEPSNGVFQLMFESAPTSGNSIDAKTADKCSGAKDVTNQTIANLTNAGMTGNLWDPTTCRTSPDPDEPLDFIYSSNGRGYNDEDCDSTGIFISGAAQWNAGNNGIYSFTVDALGLDGGVICLTKEEVKADILLFFDLFCDSVVVIPVDLFPNLFNPLTPPGSDPIVPLQDLLRDEYGENIVIPEDGTCEEVRAQLVDIIDELFGPLLGQVCVPLNCSPAVTIKLCNITMCGNEDNGAKIFVTYDDCVNGTEEMFAPIDNGVTSLTLSSGLNPLNEGTYYINVEGDAAVLMYDLTVEVDYRLGLGGAPCEASLPTEERKALANKANTLFQDMSLMPNPASNELTINFKLEKELNSVNVRVIDMTGKEVISTREVSATVGMNAHTIDVSDLSSGLYMISIEKDGQTSLSRFSKN